MSLKTFQLKIGYLNVLSVVSPEVGINDARFSETDISKVGPW